MVEVAVLSLVEGEVEEANPDHLVVGGLVVVAFLGWVLKEGPNLQLPEVVLEMVMSAIVVDLQRVD